MFKIHDSLEVFMKKSVIFSLLFLSLNGLYAMEAGESVGTIPSIETIPEGALPQEWLCQIARHKLSDEMSIAPEDAVQDVAEYAHEDNVVSSVCFSPDSKFVASGGLDGQVILADRDGKVLEKYEHSRGEGEPAYERGVSSVCISPDNSFIASSGNKKVKLFYRDGTVQEYEDEKEVSSVCISPDNTLVAFGGYEGRVKILDLSTKEIKEYRHSFPVNAVCFSPDSNWIASCADDSSSGIYHRMGTEVKIVGRDGTVRSESQDNTYGATVYFVSFSPNSKDVATGGLSRKITIADEDGIPQGEFPAPFAIRALGFSPHGELVVAGLGRKKVQIADYYGRVWAEYVDKDPVSVCVSPDGSLVMSGGYHGEVTIKSLRPLLLAQHQPKDPTLSQFLLLKRLQEKLLKDKEPLLIGQSDRAALEGMPDLNKLLKVEKSKSKTTNPVWRLQLRRGADAAPKSDESEPEPAAGWPNICSVV